MTIPQRSWFWLQPPSTLHGPGHTARVMVWAAVLTRESEWFEPVVWAAACHDLRREEDGADPDHGHRAAAWVRGELPGQLRQAPSNLELIAEACAWHVCSDREPRWDHPVLWLLKDADGLDRVRLWDLDPRFLRHAETLQWVDQARALYQATALEDDTQRIWRQAGAMGLPVGGLLEFVARQADNLAGQVPSGPTHWAARL